MYKPGNEGIKLEISSSKSDFHDSKCIRFRKTLRNFARGFGDEFLGNAFVHDENAFPQVHLQVCKNNANESNFGPTGFSRSLNAYMTSATTLLAPGAHGVDYLRHPQEFLANNYS